MTTRTDAENSGSPEMYADYNAAGRDAGRGLSGERADLAETLAQHRYFLRKTTEGMSDEQARSHPTVSQLCLGGLIKHVTEAEEAWAGFIRTGRHPMGEVDFDALTEADMARWAQGFQLGADETLAGVLARYAEVAAATDELLATVDLDAAHPLPPAPWFEPGKRWSARRVLTHIIAETAQHAGHADIIRESIDGAKTMG